MASFKLNHIMFGVAILLILSVYAYGKNELKIEEEEEEEEVYNFDNKVSSPITLALKENSPLVFSLDSKESQVFQIDRNEIESKIQLIHVYLLKIEGEIQLDDTNNDYPGKIESRIYSQSGKGAIRFLIEYQVGQYSWIDKEGISFTVSAVRNSQFSVFFRFVNLSNTQKQLFMTSHITQFGSIEVGTVKLNQVSNLRFKSPAGSNRNISLMIHYQFLAKSHLTYYNIIKLNAIIISTDLSEIVPKKFIYNEYEQVLLIEFDTTNIPGTEYEIKLSLGELNQGDAELDMDVIEYQLSLVNSLISEAQFSLSKRLSMMFLQKEKEENIKLQFLPKNDKKVYLEFFFCKGADSQIQLGSSAQQEDTNRPIFSIENPITNFVEFNTISKMDELKGSLLLINQFTLPSDEESPFKLFKSPSIFSSFFIQNDQDNQLRIQYKGISKQVCSKYEDFEIDINIHYSMYLTNVESKLQPLLNCASDLLDEHLEMGSIQGIIQSVSHYKVSCDDEIFKSQYVSSPNILGEDQQKSEDFDQEEENEIVAIFGHLQKEGMIYYAQLRTQVEINKPTDSDSENSDSFTFTLFSEKKKIE